MMITEPRTLQESIYPTVSGNLLQRVTSPPHWMGYDVKIIDDADIILVDTKENFRFEAFGRVKPHTLSRSLMLE